jgi:hypothetical protein
MTLFQLHKLIWILWHEVIVTKPWKFDVAVKIMIYFRSVSGFEHTQYAENSG